MDAPTCRLCNTKHWSREKCPAKGRVVPSKEIARETGPKEAARMTKPEKRAQRVPREPIVTSTLTIATEKRAAKQGWNRDEYNAYQRGYMKGLRRGKKVATKKAKR